MTDVMKYLSFLLDLIEDQKWSAFEKVALSNPKTFKYISKLMISECEDFNGMTLLHVCARYDAPIHVLDQMIKLYPLSLTREDCLGRTPLHVAAGSGASPWVIELLTVNYPQACSIQDEDGRTPLHFACDTSCDLFEGGDQQFSSPRGPPSFDTVEILLSGSLDAATLEDADETNAVEYAIISGAPMKVVKLLQRATQRVMKKNFARESRLARPTLISSMSRISVH